MSQGPANGSRWVYEHYDTFKGWTGFFTVSDDQRRYFEREFRDIDIAGKRVLELGYGEGNLMAWMADRAGHVAGVEINPRSLEEGRDRGFAVYPSVEALQAADTAPFDVVVAFDVLEHLELAELEALLPTLKGLMRDTGRLVARVPNGRSPWGLPNQFGDLTHRTVLSDLRFEQLALHTGFRLVFCRDYAVVPRRFLRGWTLDTIRLSARRVLNAALRRIYGLGGMPMEANIIAVLEPAQDLSART